MVKNSHSKKIGLLSLAVLSLTLVGLSFTGNLSFSGLKSDALEPQPFVCTDIDGDDIYLKSESRQDGYGSLSDLSVNATGGICSGTDCTGVIEGLCKNGILTNQVYQCPSKSSENGACAHISYTVTFDLQGATTPSSPITKIVTEPATTLGAAYPASPVKTGYGFFGWNTKANGSGTLFTENTPVKANTTVYAQWGIKNYTVNTTVGANGSITPSAKTVPYDTTTKFTVTPNTGYTASIQGCGGSMSGTTYTTGKITEDCSLVATFNPKQYSVTIKSNEGGTVSESVPVDYNTQTPITITPNMGYTIGPVSGCGVSLVENVYTTGKVTANCTVNIKFIPNDYKITFDANGANGTMADQTVAYGTPEKLSKNKFTKPTYAFLGWTRTSEPSTVVQYENGALYTPEASGITLYAQWATNAYTVTFEQTDADTHSSPLSKTVTSPATTLDTLPTPPVRTGYVFGGWYTKKDGDRIPFTEKSLVKKDITVYPQWNTYSYTVNFDANGGTRVSDAKVKSPNTTLGQFPRNPTRVGYNFTEWYTSLNEEGIQFTETTPVTDNITLYAHWRDDKSAPLTTPDIVVPNQDKLISRDSGYVFTSSTSLTLNFGCEVRGKVKIYNKSTLINTLPCTGATVTWQYALGSTNTRPVLTYEIVDDAANVSDRSSSLSIYYIPYSTELNYLIP